MADIAEVIRQQGALGRTEMDAQAQQIISAAQDSSVDVQAALQQQSQDVERAMQRQTREAGEQQRAKRKTFLDKEGRRSKLGGSNPADSGQLISGKLFIEDAKGLDTFVRQNLISWKIFLKSDSLEKIPSFIQNLNKVVLN